LTNHLEVVHASDVLDNAVAGGGPKISDTESEAGLGLHGKSDSTRRAPDDPSMQKKAPSEPGLPVIPARWRLIRYFDCVPPYRLDCLVTIRGQVSPDLRFVEGLGLLKTIPLR
jgi:hypothetical protein